MESENGVTLEDVSGSINKSHVQGSVPDSKKEVQNADSSKNVSDVNGSSVLVTKDEGPNLSGVAVEASVTSTRNETSKPSKEPRAGTSGSLKNKKVGKDQPNTKGPNPSSRKQSSLSQSLSFPARGARADGMKKSIDGYPVKKDVKNSQANGSQVSLSNGSVTSATRLSHPNRRASTGLNANEANRNVGGASVRRPTIAFVSKTQQAASGKSGSVNTMGNFLPSEVSISVDENLKAPKNALSIKEDDDARSTSSSTPRGMRRSSGSGFAFRLDERAEKRKEFFSKLEEKIQAKEEEKSSIQEKSKETKDAEIKQLRKSLTFKAAPMPSFYKEPPPKAELKKIPTTRAISPKLGRNKSTISTNNSLENGGFCASPRLNRDQSNSTKGIQANTEKIIVGLKKSIRKSQSKLRPQETAATKTEQNPVMSESKEIGAEGENQKANAEETKESQKPTEDLPEGETRIDVESEKDPAHDNGPILSSANSEIMLSEVAVGG